MRIAFVYDFPYPWHAGGIEKINKIESEALAREHDVHFYTMRWPGMKGEFTLNRVHFHTCWPASRKSMYRHRRRSIRKAIMFSLTNLRIFSRRFDLVIVDEFPYLHLPAIFLYRLLTGCRVVMRVAEVWDLPYWKRYAGSAFGTLGYLLSRTVMRADSYIANTYETKRRLSGMLNVSKDRINVFAPVLDARMIESARKRARRKQVMVFAGRLIKEKRVDKWIYEFAEVSRDIQSLRGVIIGDGPEKAYLSKIIRTLRLQDRIELRKPIKTTSGLYRALASASVTVNMSEREGMSIITLESLSLGVPVVLPDYSPIPDDIKGMCVVEHELGIPRAIRSILRSRNPSRFIRNGDRLSMFQTSGVKKFYGRLFKKLGLY